MKPHNLILRVALPIPKRTCFDYLPPLEPDPGQLQPGLRLQVPFGRRTRLGVLESITGQSEVPAHKLLTAHHCLDSVPLWPEPLLELLRWCSHYYHYPIGETLFTAMPGPLRKGRRAASEPILCFRLSAAGHQVDRRTLRNSPRQRELLDLLARRSTAVPENAPELKTLSGWRGPMQRLLHKGWVGSAPCTNADGVPAALSAEPLPQLNPYQKQVMQALETDQFWNRYMGHLLEGVTGSGKTEIYMRLIATAIQRGRQALVLLPEIGLTPQTIERFQRRFQTSIAVVHSGRSETGRIRAWQAAREGRASIVLGTRSAIWTPLARPGLIIVDEEHDRSYKQQEGMRYSARDVAVMRAKMEQIPLLLGSATPSLESVLNAKRKRYLHLRLPQRAGSARLPSMHLLDTRRCRMHGAISDPLAAQIKEEIQANRQVLLFLNRRGYASTLLCHSCGKQERCSHCDVNMTYHRERRLLLCHHCGRHRPRAQHCMFCTTGEYLEIGHGTERIEQTIAELFPQARLLRFDQDQVRRRASTMKAMLKRVHSGDADILIGTQMLAKGHHFEHVSLVGVIDADRQLYSQNFRAIEYLAQQIIQVSGRAGRGRHPGRVLIQTHHPEHPMLEALLRNNYPGVVQSALQERQATVLPPYTRLVLLQAESAQPEDPERFLLRAHHLLQAQPCYRSLTVFGPYASSMERREGRYRRQLVIQVGRQTPFAGLLEPWTLELEQLARGHTKVRWFFDVDPIETL